MSQRPICDDNRNWKKLDPKLLKCKTVDSCTVAIYGLDKTEKEKYLTDLNPRPGFTYSISDQENLTISDPVSWGTVAQLPLFFFSLFLALKLGQALSEFVFLA